MIDKKLLDELVEKDINLHRISELKNEICSNMQAEAWIFLAKNDENSHSFRDLIFYNGYGEWESKRFQLLEKVGINYKRLNEYFNYLEQAEALEGRNLVNMYLSYLRNINFLKENLEDDEIYPRYLASKHQIMRVKVDEYLEKLEKKSRRNE